MTTEFKIICPSCKTEYTIPNNYFGNTVECEICKTNLDIDYDFLKNQILRELPSSKKIIINKHPINTNTQVDLNIPPVKIFFAKDGIGAKVKVTYGNNEIKASLGETIKIPITTTTRIDFSWSGATGFVIAEPGCKYVVRRAGFLGCKLQATEVDQITGEQGNFAGGWY